uniref:Uncharacterized protein n=1 Tax=Ciona savignyi TaxID=51511 RepID=H2YW07_CIOSA
MFDISRSERSRGRFMSEIKEIFRNQSNDKAVRSSSVLSVVLRIGEQSDIDSWFPSVVRRLVSLCPDLPPP